MCCECLKKKSDKCLRIVKNRIYSLPMNLHNQSVVFVFSKSTCVICVQVNIYNCDLKTDSVSQPINIFVDRKHIKKKFLCEYCKQKMIEKQIKIHLCEERNFWYFFVYFWLMKHNFYPINWMCILCCTLYVYWYYNLTRCSLCSGYS